MSSVAAASPTADPKLYHVLMAEDDNKQEGAGSTSSSSKKTQPHPTLLLLSPKLQNDYLGRRFRALQETKPTPKKGSKKKTPPKKSAEEELWCGASAVERSLVACCVTANMNSSNPQEDSATVASNQDDTSSSRYANDDWSPVAGALARDQVVTFVGRLALHCQTAAQRGLALAILERSQEADATEQAWWKEEAAAVAAEEGGEQPVAVAAAAAAVDEEKPKKEERVIDEGPPAKRTRRSARLPAEDRNNLDTKPAAKPTSKTAASKKDDTPSKTPSNDGEAATAAPVESMSPRVVRVQQKILPDRLRLFLQAGGLRILSRWLVEAATPVKPPPPKVNSKKTAATPTTTTPVVAAPNQQQQNKEAPVEVVASPTGPLLLPLVLFLQKLPFDLQAIKQSRINKAIKGISKQLDAILPPPPKSYKASAAAADTTSTTVVDTSRTDPVAGGLSVAQVQAAVSELMHIWEEQASKAKDGESKRDDDVSLEIAADPFAKLQAALEERAEHLSQYYDNSTNNEQHQKLPDWLAQWHAAREQQSSKATASNSSTTNSNSAAADKHKRTEELARKERENERAAMMKADLAKAQEQRRELLRKLRQKQNEAVAAAGKSRFGSAHSGRAQSKGVRWKDGLGAASRQRKRDILEEVFVFIKDKDVLAAAAAEEEQASSSSGVPVNESVAAAAAAVASNAAGTGDEAIDTNPSTMNEGEDPSQL